MPTISLIVENNTFWATKSDFFISDQLVGSALRKAKKNELLPRALISERGEVRQIELTAEDLADQFFGADVGT